MEISTQFILNNRTYTKPTYITPSGLMLHSVGVPQPRASVFQNNFNKTTVVESVHYVLQRDGLAIQLLPSHYKANHCGGKANMTHLSVEMTEPNTIRYTGGATWVDKDPEATEAFVKDIYDQAVRLFAFLCINHELDPRKDGVIISHKEGYYRGVASNHGDPEHIWNFFGLTMDQFRKDVTERVDIATFNTLMDEYDKQLAAKEVSEWAREAWDKAVQAGILDGTKPRAPVTREQLAVILDRLNILG